MAASVALSGLLVAASALAYDPRQPLPADPHVVFGELDNGFRYAIRQNGKPEKRAELRLVVLAGSVNEDEDQRGLAHFVEHMVFNGTESYAGNRIIDYLESIGSRFGADLNAHTGFDETVYELQIPTDREGLLHEGIHILSEFAFKATLSTEEIEKERGVVLDEWRRGLGASKRVEDKQLPVLLRGSRYAVRLPIGLPEVIKGCDPDAIRRFYRDWYHPGRMALVAVGDLDPRVVEGWVKEMFGPVPAGTNLREPPDKSVPSAADTLFTLVDDSELRGTELGLSGKLPVPSDESTFGGYRNDLLRQAAMSLFNERLSELARSTDPPFLGAGLGTERFGRTDLVGVNVHVADGGEKRGLEAVLVEERRALLHGFTATELARRQKDMLAGIDATWAERDKTESVVYAEELVRHYVEEEPVPGIDFERDLWHEQVPSITVDECNATFRKLAAAGGLVVDAARPTSSPAVSEADLRDLLRSTGARDVAAYQDLAAGAKLIDKPLPAGRVVDRKEIPAIGVTQLTLSNGMHVFLKPTKYQSDTIVFEGDALGGTSMAEDADLPSADSADGIAAEAGWGGHSPVELEKLLAGKVASASPFFQDRHHGVSGSSTAADLPTALELAVLVMTSPNRDPGAFDRFQAHLRASLANRAADPAARYFDRLTAINTCDHPRSRPMTVERLREIDLDKALSFYRRCFANPADFAFFFVGNVNVDAVIPEIERTIGSIPASKAAPTMWVDRKVLFPTKSVRETVRAGREPRATTSLTLRSYDGTDPNEWHRVRTACSILDRRLRESLRENEGATYGVGVGYVCSLIGPARGRVGIRYGSDPSQAASLAEQVQAAIRDLRGSGPKADEVKTEKELQTRELQTSLEDNGFWLGNLTALWVRGRPLTEVLDRQARIDALDVDGLHRVFREAFDLDDLTWVDWVPAEAATGSETPEKATPEKPGQPDPETPPATGKARPR
ncbi:MAG: insulinase family protein [bacterium]